MNKHILSVALIVAGVFGVSTASAATSLHFGQSREVAGGGSGVSINTNDFGVQFADGTSISMQQRQGRDAGYTQLNGRSSIRVIASQRIAFDAGPVAVVAAPAVGVATYTGWDGNMRSFGSLGGSLSGSVNATPHLRVTAGIGIQPWAERGPGIPTIAAPTITSLTFAQNLRVGTLRMTGVYAHGNVEGAVMRGVGERVSFTAPDSRFTVGLSYAHGYQYGPSSSPAAAADVAFVAPSASAPWLSYTNGLGAFGSYRIAAGWSVNGGLLRSMHGGNQRVTDAQVGVAYQF